MKIIIDAEYMVLRKAGIISENQKVNRRGRSGGDNMNIYIERVRKK